MCEQHSSPQPSHEVLVEIRAAKGRQSSLTESGSCSMKRSPREVRNQSRAEGLQKLEQDRVVQRPVLKSLSSLILLVY